MSEQGEISVDLVREPTFTTFGSVTPTNKTPLPSIPKSPEPQVITLPEFTDSEDEGYDEPDTAKVAGAEPQTGEVEIQGATK